MTAPTPLPERDPAVPAAQQGLFRKFDVRRVDGSDAPGGKHDGCEYFVLDLDHDPHAKAALAAYAHAVRRTHPTLAADMRSRYGLVAATDTAKTMTVARLHKQLSEMVQSGQGWMKVCVNKRSFQHPLEGDGAVILSVEAAGHSWVPLLDDDGGIALRADGSERGSMCFILEGGQPLDCPPSGTNPRRGNDGDE